MKSREDSNRNERDQHHHQHREPLLKNNSFSHHQLRSPLMNAASHGERAMFPRERSDERERNANGFRSPDKEHRKFLNNNSFGHHQLRSPLMNAASHGERAMFPRERSDERERNANGFRSPDEEHRKILNNNSFGRREKN
jgi:hypothetical protein